MNRGRTGLGKELGEGGLEGKNRYRVKEEHGGKKKRRKALREGRKGM